jgi:hypothetical protein
MKSSKPMVPKKKMTPLKYETALKGDGSSVSYVAIPKSIMAAFAGKKRVPVKASLNGYVYRTTTCFMGGTFFLPVRREIREGASLEPGDRVRVALSEDLAERKVSIPSDLLRALKGTKGLNDRFKALSYTNQKEYVESVTGAKKTQTRVLRIGRILEKLRTK